MAGTRKAAAHIALGTATTSASKWFLVWLFARTAGGAASVGHYSAILAFATPVFVLSQMGLRTIFLTLSHRWPWQTYLRLRLTGILIGIVTVAGFVAVNPAGGWHLAGAIVALKVADSLVDLYMAKVQYSNRLVTLGRILIVSGLATMATASLSVWVTKSGTSGVWSAALVALLTAIWAYRESRRTIYSPSSRLKGGTREILRASAPVTTSQFLASLLFQLPVIALSLSADAASTGIFAGASYVLTAASLAGSTLQTLLLTPFRIRRENQGDSALRTHAKIVTIKILAISSLGGLAIVLLGAQALAKIYGPTFAIGLVPLLFLAIAAVTTVGAFVESVTLTVLNRYSSVTRAMGVSCIASITAGVILYAMNSDPIVLGTGMSAVGALTRLAAMTLMARSSASKRN